MKPTIALVQGNAAGVGPELMTRLLALEEVRGLANVLVVSDARMFRAGCDVTGIESPVREISAVEDADYTEGVPNLLDLPARCAFLMVCAMVERRAGEAGRTSLQS